MDHKANKMLIDATHPEETRVVVLRNGRVEEFDFESATKKPLRGNIYLAKVTRVEPSLQACFVEYGGNRHGFLAFSEIHPDYYQIPMADRQALLDEEMEAEREAEQEADERAERMARRGQRRGGGNGEREAAAGQGDQPDIETSAGDAQPADGAPSVQDDVDHGDAMTAADNAGPAADLAQDQTPTGHDDRSPTDSDDRASDPGRDVRAEATGLDDRDVITAETTAQPPEIGAGDEARAADDGDRGHVEEVPAQSEEPEVISGDDEQPQSADALEELPERPRRQRRRVYKIQEVIKRRQIMLVQVVKEERGTKGAALTTYLSLAGRYTVLMPNTGRGGGISRKITQMQDRKRLKAIAQELEVPDGMGLIIRTAGASRDMSEIRRDYEYLMRLWESVRDLTLASTAPSLVYEEGNIIKRAIRDLYTKEIDEIVVAGEEAHREAQDFMRMLMPSHARYVIRHDRPEPLFARYPAAERQLSAMFSPQVALRSGGYLVINQTEALVAIDINSGKSTREFSIEDTALNTNLEAADEIARQLKLRDLAGLIVIDFIDMEEKRNNRAVERRLKDALRFDRARIQVGRISHFGLLEMSRQRMRTGVLEGSTTKCPHCEGTGIVRSVESIALAVLRGLEDHLMRDSRSSVNVLAHAEVAIYILNHKRTYIADIERRYGIAIAVLASDRMQGANFAIERSAAPVQRRQPERAAVNMNWGFDGGSDEAGDEDDDRPEVFASEGVEDVSQRDEATDEDGDDRSESNGDAAARDGGGRRRRRRRGRGRGQGDDRWSRGEPRSGDAAARGDRGAPHAETSGGDDDDTVTADDAHSARRADAGEDGDDTPELVNGDGDEQGDATPRAEGDRDGRRSRRRRGRRGGRRQGRDEQDAPRAAVAGETTADPSDQGAGPEVNGHDGDAPAAVDVAPVAAVVGAPAPTADDATPRVAEAPLAFTSTPLPTPTAEANPAPDMTEMPPVDRPIASEPEIVSDTPARPARRGWWKTRNLGQ